uniref:RNA-directed DNA polymerase, eukaryota n=1 Tax=Tanacetum cinerariifolium TaxID=118510 RepID=A0A6L2L5P8_TANCI|nr:RNA-directed DNA polymerase, eukaryota [Tanacetum cinerariifolium]
MQMPCQSYTSSIPEFDEQNEDNSDSEDEQSVGTIKEDFGGSDGEMEGENNVSVIPDTVREEENFQVEVEESLQYPPGFTPCDVKAAGLDKNTTGINETSGVGGEKLDSISVGSRNCKKVDIKRTRGSLLTVMEELIKVGLNPKAKKDWVKEICVSHKVNFLTLQETKMESITLFDVKCSWGNFAFDHVYSPAVGNSGGILCVWEKSLFNKINSTVLDYFVMIRGTWVCSGVNLLIISVYAPHEFSEKKMLWDYLGQVITKWNGEVIVMGDFNEVRYKNERYGSVFHAHGADAFNNFLSNANLQEIPLGGCAFTWCHISASKTSKLDRFLMSKGLLSANLNFSAITLDRYLSDHRPIMLRESFHDYGPIPFRSFHYWFEIDGFEEMISKAWYESPAIEVNPMLKLMYKMKFLIREWNAIQEVDKVDNMEVAQKAKIKWAIEGDENTKYYNRILNKKRNQLAIRGVLKDGIWIENLNLVKSEFLLHFKNRFQKPCSVRPVLDMTFPRQLSAMQQIDMESNVSYQEIKRAMWDCGVDKSPGPDGFTFGFIRRFWSLLEKDVVAAVKYFFTSDTFPKGCKASFIALIMKIPDAKMSLHLSFKRVEGAGMFNGIMFNFSMLLSHMFYADDAIFMGQWSNRNIDTLIYMLKCFQRASGLSINLSKSSKVGGCMSRIKSWDEVMEKMVNRLSKWKMKTLSIGGRLTLFKAVLRSMPIYHMSIFKVPISILQHMESIRCHFFNGSDLNSKKSTWVSWNKVLASKEKGLGKAGHASIWCDIIKEMDRVATQGIDLVSMMQMKIGNGSNTGVEFEQWRDMLESLDGVLLSPVEDRWIKEVPIKVNINAWKVSLDGLPTRWNISRRGMDIPSILCLLCELAIETSKHLFFECAVVKDIFRKICNCFLAPPLRVTTVVSGYCGDSESELGWGKTMMGVVSCGAVISGGGWGWWWRWRSMMVDRVDGSIIWWKRSNLAGCNKEEFGLIEYPKSMCDIWRNYTYYDQLVDLNGEVGYVCTKTMEFWLLNHKKEWVPHCRFKEKIVPHGFLIDVIGCWNKDGDILIKIISGDPLYAFYVYNLKSGD